MSSLKTQIRVPCRDPYGYIEVAFEGTKEEIRDAYAHLFTLMNDERKYPELTFNEMICKVMDSDLTDWQITTEEYANLTESQQKVYQSIKRFRKRLPEEIE